MTEGVEAVRASVQASIDAKQALLADAELLDGLASAAALVTDAYRAGNKTVFFGNGGSAADATHMAAEFVGRFRFDRAPLPSLSLSDNGSSVTAIGNDFGYDKSFERQVQALVGAGDIVVGLSTSGTSVNVVKGLEAAGAAGATRIGFTGEGGGTMPDVCELCLKMPSTETARIQECYMLLLHTLCELVERALFSPA